ncbi:MAG TPA: cytochrome c [Gemmatimonadales bacterium]|nr:cytochrome c [Gemmatimonadales bacterium]
MRSRTAVLVAALLGLAACGGKSGSAAPAGGTAAAAPASDLTPWQLANGVGPITEATVLKAMGRHEVEEGKTRFEQVCASCHKANERYVGPALGGVVQRRTPQYVMNMILAPDTMVARHPEAKALFGSFMMQMPNLGLTPEQAQEVMEYLRTLPAPPATPAQ